MIFLDDGKGKKMLNHFPILFSYFWFFPFFPLPISSVIIYCLLFLFLCSSVGTGVVVILLSTTMQFYQFGLSLTLDKKSKGRRREVSGRQQHWSLKKQLLQNKKQVFVCVWCGTCDAVYPVLVITSIKLFFVR